MVHTVNNLPTYREIKIQCPECGHTEKVCTYLFCYEVICWSCGKFIKVMVIDVE